MPARAQTICTRCGRRRKTGTQCKTCERRRPSPSQRGYDNEHRKLREQWRPIVEAGDVTCWRCRQPINPGEPWDLGHADGSRTEYAGPEHQHCNRATQARRQGRT